MKKTIFVVALSIAGFIGVWQFEPSRAPAPVAPVASVAAPGVSGNSSVGTAEDTDFGTVQVRVTFTGTRISDVTLVQEPTSGRGVAALPQLHQEALQAQSAQIDTVSGATMTSEAYIHSLQAALDAR
ncbi:FMN-binding protein [Amycolatopsis jejuensis]|uniref:FMN-binding protein n=1 Tax=Amycolatopsis jejuensis TaxID=330084 RepID=UPI000525C637|nr:FMN-binding protein [Amycolatopsis jejuensis]